MLQIYHSFKIRNACSIIFVKSVRISVNLYKFLQFVTLITDFLPFYVSIIVIVTIRGVDVMYLFTLYHLIETHRKELHSLAKINNFDFKDPIVIKKSHYLDKLINTYILSMLIIYVND